MEANIPVPVSQDVNSRLGAISRSFDRFLETVCVLGLAVMVTVTALQVFCRYVLNAALAWPEEVSRWLFAWVVFLGMAIAVRRNGHIRIDMGLDLLPTKVRAWFEWLIDALTVTTCTALAIHGWETAQNATGISASFQWSFKYEYMAVPVGALLALYYLARQSLGRWSSPVTGLASFALGVAFYWFLQGQAEGLLSWQQPTTILLVSGLVLLVIGMPVGFALTLSSFLAFWPQGPLTVLALAQSMVSQVDSFVLLSVPFFILAAGLMNEGGITLVLVKLADTLVGHIRGGLGQVNVLTNTFMAGLSGSSAGDAAGTCKVLVPAMKRQGYDPAFSAALTASSSIMANVIPPSIGMLIYGALASVSIGALFLAGVIPGLIMTASLMLVVYVQSRRHNYGANRKRANLGEILRAFRGAVWALGMPVIIIVGIRFGVFTPTEAASVAVVYALLVGMLIYRGLSWRRVLANMNQAVLETTGVMFIIGASAPFAWLLVVQQVPQMLASQLGVLISNPYLLMLAVNIFLLLVGLPLEMSPAMVILVPILVPIVTQAGIDPVYFGIVMIINLMIGSITPPVGVLVFIASSITKVPAHRVFAAVIPFEIALIVALLIITYVPAATLWLPQLISGR